jgi:hypothetical protein
MRNERRRREEGARGGGGWSPIGLGLSIVLHVLAIGFIFVAPHPLPAPHPTAYTVEIVDPALRSFEVFELAPDKRYVKALGAADGLLTDVPGCAGLTIDLDAQLGLRFAK